MMIPESEWKWFGNAGHFILGAKCRFHLCTQVGPWLISTVGEYVPPDKVAGPDSVEHEYLAKNPFGETIGCDRFFETYVFKAGKPCDSELCKCGMPGLLDSAEDDSLHANDRRTANANHMTLCKKYASESH